MVKFSAIKALAKRAGSTALKAAINQAGGAAGIQSTLTSALAPRLAAAVGRAQGMAMGGVVVIRVPAKKRKAAPRRRRARA